MVVRVVWDLEDVEDVGPRVAVEDDRVVSFFGFLPFGHFVSPGLGFLNSPMCQPSGQRSIASAFGAFWADAAFDAFGVGQDVVALSAASFDHELEAASLPLSGILQDVFDAAIEGAVVLFGAGPECDVGVALSVFVDEGKSPIVAGVVGTGEEFDDSLAGGESSFGVFGSDSEGAVLAGGALDGDQAVVGFDAEGVVDSGLFGREAGEEGLHVICLRWGLRVRRNPL